MADVRRPGMLRMFWLSRRKCPELRPLCSCTARGRHGGGDGLEWLCVSGPQIKEFAHVIDTRKQK